MDTNQIKLGIVAAMGTLLLGFQMPTFPEMEFPKAINTASVINELPQNINWAEIGEKKHPPTHRQVVWRYVLEWCESRGDKNIVNPKDKDGTASYFSYQFKPGTLKRYLDRYKLLDTKEMEKADLINWTHDYDLTTEILNRMMGERESINWKREFPQCVAKYGLPPAD